MDCKIFIKINYTLLSVFVNDTNSYLQESFLFPPGKDQCSFIWTTKLKNLQYVLYLKAHSDGLFDATENERMFSLKAFKYDIKKK